MSLSTSEPVRIIFDKLFKIWGEAWAKSRGTRVDWIAYRQTEIQQKLNVSRLLRDVSFLSCTVSEIGDELTLCENPIGEESESDWSLACNNLSDEVIKVKSFTAVNHISESRSWSSTVIADLTLELGAGIYAGDAARVTSGLGFTRRRFGTVASFRDEEKGGELFEQTINCLPWRKTFVKVISNRIAREDYQAIKIHFTGGVVICCKNKVEFQECSNPERGQIPHYKWFISIGQIFSDLSNYAYSSSELITPMERNTIHRILPFLQIYGDNLLFTTMYEIKRLIDFTSVVTYEEFNLDLEEEKREERPRLSAVTALETSQKITFEEKHDEEKYNEYGAFEIRRPIDVILVEARNLDEDKHDEGETTLEVDEGKIGEIPSSQIRRPIDVNLEDDRNEAKLEPNEEKQDEETSFKLRRSIDVNSVETRDETSVEADEEKPSEDEIGPEVESGDETTFERVEAKQDEEDLPASTHISLLH